MFQCNRKVILNHPDRHCFIIQALAFNMIQHIANPQTGVGNNLPIFQLMFITKLNNLNILRICGMEHLINKRNHQISHLLHHCPENIIEYSIVGH